MKLIKPRAFFASVLQSVFLLCLLSPACPVANAAGGIKELELSLDSIMSEISTPGAAVAIVSADSIIWIGTFGVANIETGEPVTEKTQFCLGSCTKSFTGLGFLRLLDEGRIDLNTPVREIAPEIEIDNPWETTLPVRVIHLLEHTAGFDDSHMNWFYMKGPRLSLQEALKEKADLHRVRWPPGTRFSYSSPGFTLAGYILQKVSGQRYEEFIAQALLEPIGMKNSGIAEYKAGRQPQAVGYDRNIEPVPVWYDYDVPAGSMYSSIDDMALFVQFLLNRGAVGDRRIISDSLFDRIGRPTTTLAARAGLKSGYSFGIGIRYEGGVKWLGHSGAVFGFVSEYFYNPDCNLGFVVLQNSFGIFFSSSVFDCVWDYVKSHVDSVSPPSEPVSCDRLEAYCGYYEPRNPRMQLTGFIETLTGGVTILCENDTLYTQDFMEDKAPLIHVSENLFRRPGDPEATRIFAETPDGDMLYASQGLYYVRTPVWRTYLYRILVFGAVIIMLSSIAYALFWIPVHIYKIIRHKENRCRYISMRLVPLLAVVSLILGTLKMGDQTIIEFGQMTVLNVIFFLSTLLFAGLSMLSLVTAYRSFRKSVKTTARIYAVLLSAACFGMTLYLGYYGVIGLRLWAY